MIYQVNTKLRKNLSCFFEGMTDTMILSCLQGHMGEAWVDNLNNPTMVELILGDFVFFAGNSNGESAEELLINIPLNSIVVTEDRGWKSLIENFYKDYLKKINRYSFFKNREVLNIDYLKSLIKDLPKGYELKALDRDLIDNYDLNELSADFTAQFNSLEDYLNRGKGYYILSEGKVISGASSYSIYNQGIEIEIDTHKEYRKKGFATVVAAALMVECLEDGLYPSWDAANLISVGLAEKLGYKMDKKYEVYQISYPVN